LSVSLDQLPASFAAVWGGLRDELVGILADELIALWAYGARTFPDPPRSLGDFDTFAIISGLPEQERAKRVQSMPEAMEQEHQATLDTKFVLAADAVGPERPALVWRQEREEHWAFHRAHWLAGRYVLLHGHSPEELVVAPTSRELEEAVRLEIEHLERHVAAGDDDPYEASYAVLNGSRILYFDETGDAAISKRMAGEWALEHLPARWHEPLKAASRAYDGEASPHDAAVLREAMAPFVATVKSRSFLS
jgi:Domain of unknown function (DUF4111)